MDQDCHKLYEVYLVGESLDSIYYVLQILFLLTMPIKCHVDNIFSWFKTKFESPESNTNKIVNKQ